MSQYLATVQQIKDLTAISNNVDSKMINPYLDTAQVMKMKPNLGHVFMESLLAQLATEIAVSTASATNPVVITTDGNHGFATNDSVYVQGATGMTGINGQWTITVTGLTTFRLNGLDGSAFPAYNAGTATVTRMPAANVALMPYVRKAYAWWVLRDAMPFIWMHVTNSTLSIQGVGGNRGIGGEGGTPASASDMKWMQASAQNIAEGYSHDMIKFLSCNSADYPEWVTCCTGVDGVQVGMLGISGRGFKKKLSFG